MSEEEIGEIGIVVYCIVEYLYDSTKEFSLFLLV